MSSVEKSIPEREQTDESLRVEREKTDDVMDSVAGAQPRPAVEDARDRADETVAQVRAKTDRLIAMDPPIAESPELIEKERELEDEAIRRERAEADLALRVEREHNAAVLEKERAETDRDLSRERMRADHAIATRDELLGIVSHDLRNMLGTMVGFAALVAKAQEEDNHTERVLGYVQRIQRAGGRMERLIGDLVDLASIHAGSLAVKRELCDVAHLATEAVEALQTQAAAARLSMTLHIAPPLPPAALDSARIHQVLINLLSNAIKFTPPGGSVVVEVERSDDDICIHVRDTGLGIPRDKLGTVFERFVQVSADRRGVGLGLYISKCIAIGHGGSIDVESVVGRGSTFTLKLPIGNAS